MKLMPTELADTFPKLYEQQDKADDAVVHAKYFTPDSSWTWYCLEYCSESGDMFAWVDSGYCQEYGYVNLREMESVRGPLGVRIERDLYLPAGFTIADAKRLHRTEQSG